MPAFDVYMIQYAEIAKRINREEKQKEDEARKTQLPMGL